MHTYAWWSGWWWIWWVVWIIIIIWLFTLWFPGGRARAARMTPLEVLQHRLARGEITPEEYEQRLALLKRDQRPPGT